MIRSHTPSELDFVQFEGWNREEYAWNHFSQEVVTCCSSLPILSHA